MVRALITGGGGFIGSHLAERLHRHGHSVTVFDNLSRKGSADRAAKLAAFDDVTVEVGDVLDVDALDQVMKEDRVDVVVHLAAQTAVTRSLADPYSDFEVNAVGTLRILEAVRRRSAEALVIFASTNKVYGDLAGVPLRKDDTRYLFADGRVGIDEDQPLHPQTPYGCSKATADLYVREYVDTYGLRGVVLRQSCVYGTYDYAIEDQGWLAWLVEGIVLDRPLRVYGDGLQVRDVLWIEDLLDLYERVVERPAAAVGEVFNVGGGATFSISVWTEFEVLMAEVLGRPLQRPSFLPWRSKDQRCYITDLSKVTRMLEWKPRVSPERGLATLAASVRLTTNAKDGPS